VTISRRRPSTVFSSRVSRWRLPCLTGRDQPPPRRELFDQRRRDVRAGRRDADPVVGGVRRVTQSAVAVKEDRVAVAGPVQILAGERERCGVDIDRHDQALATHHLPCQGGAVPRPHADLEEPVPPCQAERLVEQRIAVRAGDSGPLAGERQGDLLVGVVPVARRDEVLASHREHRPAEPFGAKEPAPPQLPDLRLPLAPQVPVALERSARRRNKPPAHRPRQPLRTRHPASGGFVPVWPPACSRLGLRRRRGGTQRTCRRGVDAFVPVVPADAIAR
jgi:hypothetical protein